VQGGRPACLMAESGLLDGCARGLLDLGLVYEEGCAAFLFLILRRGWCRRCA
jgi:hypothetical protein